MIPVVSWRCYTYRRDKKRKERELQRKQNVGVRPMPTKSTIIEVNNQYSALNDGNETEREDEKETDVKKHDGTGTRKRELSTGSVMGMPLCLISFMGSQ